MHAAISFITVAAMSLGMASAAPSCTKRDDHDGPLVDGDIKQVGEATIKAELYKSAKPVSSEDITVKMDEVYTNSEVLNQISKLTVTDYDGDGDLTVYCQSFDSTDGKGRHGPTFSNGEEGPAHLSQNAVVVGSIVCRVDYAPDFEPYDPSKDE